MLTHEYLRDILHYSIITGKFHWIKPRPSIKVGDIAGSCGKGGYIRIKINSKTYSAHRLAFFYLTGEWPKNEIDHKDGQPGNNYWLNLREATRSQNSCNTKVRSDNASGLKGINWDKSSGKWRATITLNRKQKHIGLFSDINDACVERRKIENELHKDFSR